MRLRDFQVFAIQCIGIGFIVGCGQNAAIPVVVPVKGTVTLDGQPLAGASLTFITSEPKVKNGVATTDDQGKFEVLTYFDTTHILKGVVAGEYKVTVTKTADSTESPPPVVAVPRKEDRAKMQAENIKRMTEASKKGPKSGLPDKYGKAATSGLKAVASAGMEPLKFELKN